MVQLQQKCYLAGHMHRTINPNMLHVAGNVKAVAFIACTTHNITLTLQMLKITIKTLLLRNEFVRKTIEAERDKKMVIICTVSILKHLYGILA